jgi:hypothetical protein
MNTKHRDMTILAFVHFVFLVANSLFSVALWPPAAGKCSRVSDDVPS